MLHTGLFGGVAAGGPAAASPLSLPETPDATATETPVDLDALARAFRELMEVFEQHTSAAEPARSESGETPTIQTMAQVSIAPEIFDLDDDADIDSDADIDPFFDAGTIDVDMPEDDEQGEELLTWLVATDVPPPAVAPALKTISGEQPVTQALPRVPHELPKLPVHVVRTAEETTEQPAVAPTDVPEPAVPAAEMSTTNPQQEANGNSDQAEPGKPASRQGQHTPANVPAATPVIPFNITPLTRRDHAPHEISSLVRKPAVTAARTVAVIAPASLPAGALRLPVEIERGTAPAAPEQLPSSTASQIVQSLRLALSRHGGEAHIKLDPEQFGDLSIAMRVDRGQVVARVQAESPAVREWVQANREVLRTGLGDHNLRLDRLDVITTDEARGSRERDDERHSGEERHPQPRRPRKPSSGETFDIVA